MSDCSVALCNLCSDSFVIVVENSIAKYANKMSAASSAVASITNRFESLST